jgi:sec-independent protein translocase protein TatB
MFDVSFSELIVIGAVALVVIGPERLPKVARTVGHLVGRAQRYVNDVKGDIQREMDLGDLSSLKDQMEDAARSVKSSLEETSKSLQAPLQEAKDALADASQSLHEATHAAASEPAVPDTQKSLPGFAEASALVEETHPKPPTGTPQ